MPSRNAGKQYRTLKDVWIDVESEGFHYAFKHYSDYKDVKDAEFHKLRVAYLAAAEALARHIGLDE